jgi:DNA-binding NtrC family response regulator
MKHRVLFVDDEPAIRDAVARFFRNEGLEVRDAARGDEAVRLFEEWKPDVAILDHNLPDCTSVDLVRAFHGLDPAVPLVVLTAYGSIELAVDAIREGADQFLTKPMELPALLAVIRRLIATRRGDRVLRARDAGPDHAAIHPFVGTSRAMRRLEEEAARAAETASPALLLGETGSGKGVVAAWIHRRSERHGQPFVDLNCAGLARDLLESELFGHEKGAFTGATARKQGLVELAHRGTLFLDEIGDADAQVQAKLLKVIEERAYRRVGDVKRREVDVRFLVATHLDLGRRMAEGRFREDLYYRVSTLLIHVPPLRDRAEDIPALAEALLLRVARDLGREPALLTAEAVKRLRDHPWPGNVRELRNVLERAVLHASSRELTARDLGMDGPVPVRAHARGDRSLRAAEQAHIEQVLGEERGDVVRAAAVLKISRSALYERIRKHGIRIPGRPRAELDAVGSERVAS